MHLFPRQHWYIIYSNINISIIYQYALLVISKSIVLMLKANREVYVYIQYTYIFGVFKIHLLSINIMYWYIFNVRLLFTNNALIDILRGQKTLIGNIIVLWAMCVLYNILLFIMPWNFFHANVIKTIKLYWRILEKP